MSRTGHSTSGPAGRPPRAPRVIAVLCLAVALCLAAGTARAGDIAVVVNPNFPADRLSLEDVRRIFLGEQAFVDDTLVHPVHYARGGALADAFLKHTVALSRKGFDRYWVREVFRSGRFPPATVDSVPAMLRLVATQRGAIGYVPAEALTGVTTVKPVLTFPMSDGPPGD